MNIDNDINILLSEEKFKQRFNKVANVLAILEEFSKISEKDLEEGEIVCGELTLGVKMLQNLVEKGSEDYSVDDIKLIIKSFRNLHELLESSAPRVKELIKELKLINTYYKKDVNSI
jgi:predicted transcriptional regulator